MKNIISVLLAILPFFSQAQTIGNYLGDETLMYAETKQVNQFFRRFNNEEDKTGKKYSSTSQQYRDNRFRPDYINILFDRENKLITEELKASFINQVTDSENPQFLEFHGGEWFSEVVADFIWKGKSVKLSLFLQLEKENLGYKWVITNIYFKPFNDLLSEKKDDNQAQKFLHPMSHELDFMNLIKVFGDKKHLTDYAARDFEPDYLTLMIYEIKQNNLKFENISTVKFHFFQLDGWYFELSEFNRKGYNTGWLISNLTQVEEKHKNVLLKYILHQS